MITQRFWQFFGVFSGFLGAPKTTYFGGLSLYFENFFARKTVGSWEIPRHGLFNKLITNTRNLYRHCHSDEYTFAGRLGVDRGGYEEGYQKEGRVHKNFHTQYKSLSKGFTQVISGFLYPSFTNHKLYSFTNLFLNMYQFVFLRVSIQF